MTEYRFGHWRVRSWQIVFLLSVLVVAMIWWFSFFQGIPEIDAFGSPGFQELVQQAKEECDTDPGCRGEPLYGLGDPGAGPILPQEAVDAYLELIGRRTKDDSQSLAVVDPE